MLRIAEAWGATYPGRKAGPNQDGILVQDVLTAQGQTTFNGQLPLQIAVADGISGDPGGEVASYLALAGMRGQFPRSLSQAVDVLAGSNRKIARAAMLKREIRSMCTTIAAAWIYEDSIVWCTRGDTPIYIVTDKGISEIARPHIDYAGYITSYMGAGAHVTIGTTDGGVISRGLDLVRAVVIMSDGISKFVSEGSLDVLAFDTQASISSLGMHLMRRAFRNDSYDNMSFVMARLAWKNR